MAEKAIMILAVALVVSSLMMSLAVWTAGNTVGAGLAKVQINVQGGGSGVGSGSGTGSGQLQPTPVPTPQVDYRDLIGSYAGTIGNANAPITIVEFSDYQCPFCRRAFEDAEKKVIENYVNTGKARIIFKDFPLSFHPDAPAAANAARCAGEQSKYWEMHDKIFVGQGAAELGTVRINATAYSTYAKELKLDEAKFKTCVDSNKYAADVQSDTAQGIAAGVSGTPTFFINNQQIVGAQPYEAFKAAIDAELAKAG